MLDSPADKVAGVLRRWLLPVLVLTLVAGYGGALLSRELTASYTAQAALVVPPQAGGAQPGLGTPVTASQLAETYAAAITASGDLRTAVSAATGAPLEALTAELTAEAGEDTSVVTLTYVGASEAEVVAVLTSAVGVLVGPAPPTPVAAGTLAPISVPEAAEPTSVRATGTGVTAAVAGLLLALFLAWAVERSDACADRVTDLRGALLCPVTDWRRPTAALAQSLLEQWEVGAGRQLAVIGIGRLSDGQLQTVGEVFRQAGDAPLDVRVSSSRDRGSGYDAVAQSGDVVVVAVRRGSRRADVDEVVTHLGQLGVTPAWALLTARRVRPSPVREPAGG